MEARTALDILCDGIKLEERPGAIKVYFELEGCRFSYSRGPGMIRMATIARSLLELSQTQNHEIIAGKFDYLLYPLLERTMYVPDEEKAAPVSLSDYDDFLETIERDVGKAAGMGIHTDIGLAVSVACLGKSLLAEISPDLSKDSTSGTLKDPLEENTETPAEPAESTETTSGEHAPAFSVEVN